MAWYVTGTAWVPVLVPCATYIRVLLVDSEVDVLAVLLEVVCHYYPHDPCTKGYDLEVPVLGIIDDCL